MRNFFSGALLFTSLPVALVTLVAGSSLGQTTSERIGYDALIAEYGENLPDGSETVVALVEAYNGSNSGYLPNPDVFPGKTINDQGVPPNGESAAVSGHSTGSARAFFGSNSSSPGTDNIDIFSAGYWLGGGALVPNGGRDPLSQPYNISSHSYIFRGSSSFGQSEATQILQRLDYYIDQSDSLVVAGSSNGRSTTLPLGLAPSINALSVGTN